MESTRPTDKLVQEKNAEADKIYKKIDILDKL